MKIAKRMEKRLLKAATYDNPMNARVSLDFYDAWCALRHTGNERFHFKNIFPGMGYYTFGNLRDAGQTEFTASIYMSPYCYKFLEEAGCTFLGIVDVKDERHGTIKAKLYRLPWYERRNGK